MDDKTVSDCISELDQTIQFCKPLEVHTSLEIFQRLTCLMRSSETRNELQDTHWKVLTNIFQLFSEKTPQTDEEFDLFIELFRFLRNCCGGSKTNLCFILNDPVIFLFAKKPLIQFIRKDTAKEILILKVCIQLFGNILASCDSTKSSIWSLFLEDKLLRQLIEHNNVSVQECALMVLFNCMSKEPAEYIMQTQDGHELLIVVTNLLLHNQIDWGVLFVEYLLCNELLKHCFEILPLKNRLLVLDVLSELLKSSENNISSSIPTSTIEDLKILFLKNVSHIYSMNEMNLEPEETVSMLSILCSASISNSFVSVLQSSQDLLSACVECLKSIHLLGKQHTNMFSSLSDVEHMTTQFSREIASHPLYGFKKDLIRLIGNLCYNCKSNQDLVRSIDGIPLILDCCKFDARNPYIIQWCILAIRNLLDKNPDNQTIVAAMTVSGEIVNQQLLQEMGFRIRKEDGKYRISSVTGDHNKSS